VEAGRLESERGGDPLRAAIERRDHNAELARLVELAAELAGRAKKAGAQPDPGEVGPERAADVEHALLSRKPRNTSVLTEARIPDQLSPASDGRVVLEGWIQQ
jgi:hypothetical protein